jgi:hypothetical protein
MRSVVECDAGYRGEQETVALHLGGCRLEVTEVVGRWLAPAHRYFKVSVNDGRRFVVLHRDETPHTRELTALVGSAAGARCPARCCIDQ